MALVETIFDSLTLMQVLFPMLSTLLPSRGTYSGSTELSRRFPIGTTLVGVLEAVDTPPLMGMTTTFLRFMLRYTGSGCSITPFGTVGGGVGVAYLTGGNGRRGILLA